MLSFCSVPPVENNSPRSLGQVPKGPFGIKLLIWEVLGGRGVRERWAGLGQQVVQEGP